jgi:hypothetical protein
MLGRKEKEAWKWHGREKKEMGLKMNVPTPENEFEQHPTPSTPATNTLEILPPPSITPSHPYSPLLYSTLLFQLSPISLSLSLSLHQE